MGSPIDEKGRKENEGPQHKVTLSKAFAVGKFEVSRGQYAEFVKNANYTGEKPCTVAKSTKEKGLQETSYKQTNDHPVVCVSWDDAQAYVKWLSKKSGFRYRLLTEAEWEYAARAGTTSAFSYGPTITTRQANFNDQIQATATVGSYSANAFGLFDMAGNVSEWTEDCYKDSYTHADGNGDAINVSGCQRVWRGGGWLSDLLNVRSAYRNRNLASQRNNLLGFRVARVL